MKIYYAMSISGEQNPESENINTELILYLKNFGDVLTEHFSNPALIGTGETKLTNKEIHDRDLNWLLSADIIVAEVSNVSLGVGYEIGRAVENNKKILCIRKKSTKRLSAMISGCEHLTLKEYTTPEEVKSFIKVFFANL
ncbi:MAG: nucleoside 2-deoxyribosyltransferase [Ignavibacteriae bacterium]|nr:nucleoside 2-deoxyribosyltransferase [Ignavibacteriota bacterium]